MYIVGKFLFLKGTGKVVYCNLLRYSCWHLVRWVPCHHGMAHPQAVDGGKAPRYGW